MKTSELTKEQYLTYAIYSFAEVVDYLYILRTYAFLGGLHIVAIFKMQPSKNESR